MRNTDSKNVQHSREPQPILHGIASSWHLTKSSKVQRTVLSTQLIRMGENVVIPVIRIGPLPHYFFSFAV